MIGAEFPVTDHGKPFVIKNTAAALAFSDVARGQERAVSVP